MKNKQPKPTISQAKKCSYCDKTEHKITKEHVVNKAFIDKFHKDSKGYAHSYKNHTKNYQTAKDVCSNCNNAILSEFDDYFLEFYEAHIPKNRVTNKTRIILTYDFEKLSKWILKTLYNSERKNAYQQLPKKMHRFKNYILGRDKRSKLFKIYFELLQDIPNEEFLKYGHVTEEEIPAKMDFLKVSNSVLTEEMEKGKIESTFKHIVSSNFMFHIFILDPGDHKPHKFSKIFDKYVKGQSIDKLVELDASNNQATVYASQRNLLDILDNTYEGEDHIVESMRPKEK